jgi:hypothetical protein
LAKQSTSIASFAELRILSLNIVDSSTLGATPRVVPDAEVADPSRRAKLLQQLENGVPVFVSRTAATALARTLSLAASGGSEEGDQSGVKLLQQPKPAAAALASESSLALSEQGKAMVAQINAAPSAPLAAVVAKISAELKQARAASAIAAAPQYRSLTQHETVSALIAVQLLASWPSCRWT